MFARRSDLPLDKDALSRFLPWLIAFMVFLAILAMAGMLVLNATASRWDQGIRGTLTVQVMPAEDPAKDDERLQAVLSVLAQMPEIDHYETLTDDRLLKLLEPWLGPATGSRDLPLPRLVDVELKTGADLNAEVLSRQLAARVPGTSVDDHRIWLKRLVRLIQTVEGLAALVLAFIALATVGLAVPVVDPIGVDPPMAVLVLDEDADLHTRQQALGVVRGELRGHGCRPSGVSSGTKQRGPR